jgi:hypothetical protein
VEGDRIAILEYCEELDCLHEDLEFILFDVETALDFSYPEEPYFQRLALIYHGTTWTSGCMLTERRFSS